MHTGMLWFDNDPKTSLVVKIERAMDYYRHKYGCEPTLCLIHPSALTDNEQEYPITVRAYRPVLPGHLWLGIDEKH